MSKELQPNAKQTQEKLTQKYGKIDENFFSILDDSSRDTPSINASLLSKMFRHLLESDPFIKSDQRKVFKDMIDSQNYDFKDKPDFLKYYHTYYAAINVISFMIHLIDRQPLTPTVRIGIKTWSQMPANSQYTCPYEALAGDVFYKTVHQLIKSLTPSQDDFDDRPTKSLGQIKADFAAALKDWHPVPGEEGVLPSTRSHPLSRNSLAQDDSQQAWKPVGISAAVIAGLGIVAGLTFGVVKLVKLISAYSLWKKRNPHGNFKTFLRVRGRKTRS